MKNFEDILNLFKNENACVQIESKSELTNAYKELLNNNELRINMIDNATEVVANNRGSSDKQFKYINDLINYEISNSNN
jgi:3-deoxy-D-manno-octulosonic-acid transferase